MTTMGAFEAANAIRTQVSLQHMDPHDQHALNFLKEVAAHLGLEPTPEAVTHIADLLQRNDITIYRGAEFPKMVGPAGRQVTVNTPEEEAEALASFEQKPATVEEAKSAETETAKTDTAVDEDDDVIEIGDEATEDKPKGKSKK